MEQADPQQGGHKGLYSGKDGGFPRLGVPEPLSVQQVGQDTAQHPDAQPAQNSPPVRQRLQMAGKTRQGQRGQGGKEKGVESDRIGGVLPKGQLAKN